MSEHNWRGWVDGDWGNAENWSSGAIPAGASADVIVPANATRNITSGLGQSAVDVTSFTIEKGCSINIGTIDKPLQLGRAADTTWVLDGTGTYVIEVAGSTTPGTTKLRGSGTFYIDSYSTEEAADFLYVDSSTVTAYLGWRGESGAAAAATIMNVIDNRGGGTVYIGAGVSKTGGTDGPAINNAAGTMTINGEVTTLNIEGGVVNGNTSTAAHIWTTVNVRGGRMNYNGIGVISALNVFNAGTADFSGASSVAEVTTVNMRGAGVYNDPGGAVPATTVFNLDGTYLGLCTVNFGQDRTITLS